MLVGTHQRLAKISSFQIMARDTTLEKFTSTNILVLYLIHVCPGMIMSTFETFLPTKFHRGWVCYERLERSCLERHLYYIV
jgi:hypothetical protein